MSKIKDPMNPDECPITVTFEDVELMFRNFSGKESPMNRAGARNFNIKLNREQAEELMACGWNVKKRAPREDAPEGAETVYHLKVNVKLDGQRPPKIILLSSRGKNPLVGDEVSMLDWAEITKCDVIIRAYHYNVGGEEGISAYLNSMYVEIFEDPLELKYANWGEDSDE